MSSALDPFDNGSVQAALFVPSNSAPAGGGGGGGGETGPTGPEGATGATGPALPLYQATYYKSVVQNLTSGATDITFDEVAAWNNDGGYITHTPGSTDFTVVQGGLYQLEWNATVIANGATWTSSLLKQISIDITRSPAAEVVSIAQNASMPSALNYGQSLCSTFNLEAGDVINCRISNTFFSGTPTAQGVTNTFDLNTWFSWRYVSTGPAGPAGETGPSGPEGVAGRAGDTGPAGETGPTGPAGTPGGATGATGPTGESGPQGAQGEIGASGAAGANGDTGPTGVTGPQGAQGVIGFTGETGPTGVSGPSGPAGANGDTGPTGVSGPSGASGPSGPSGASGPAGVSGPTGETGPTGVSGPSGASGPSGPAGTPLVFKGLWDNGIPYVINDVVVASNNNTYVCILATSSADPISSPTNWTIFVNGGATGPSGPSGATGASGLAGVSGPAGGTGETGPTGASGASGASGPAGGTGETGPTGVSGPSGPTGPSGPSGPTLTFTGIWSDATSYVINQVVVAPGGDTYVSLTSNTNSPPASNPTDWALYALMGPSGPSGATGPSGAAGGVDSITATGTTCTGAITLEAGTSIVIDVPTTNAIRIAAIPTTMVFAQNTTTTALDDTGVTVVATSLFTPDVTGAALVTASVTVLANDAAAPEITMTLVDSTAAAIGVPMTVTSTGSGHKMTITNVAHLPTTAASADSVSVVLTLSAADDVDCIAASVVVTYNSKLYVAPP